MLKPSAATCVVCPLSMYMGTREAGTPLGERLAAATPNISTHITDDLSASDVV